MMVVQTPEEDSPESRDGTAAHWVAAVMLRGQGAGNGLIGQRDPDGTLITKDILQSAEVFVNDVQSTLAKYGRRDALLIEHPVRAARIHQEVWGTLDAAWFDGSRLIVWDFKHGHAEVSPVWNEQLLCYLAGVLDYWKIDGLQDQQITVELRIVQPRCYSTSGPVRGFQFKASDARSRFNILSAAASAAWLEGAQTMPGPHCKYCPARATCPAQRNVAMFGADYAHFAIPEKLTADGLSFELQVLDWLLPQLKGRQDALVAEASVRIGGGEFIPGYVMQGGKGQRRFNMLDTELLEYGKALGVDLSQSDKPVTPSEAERRCKAAGHDPAVLLAGLIDTPSTAPKLKSAADSEAVRVFSYQP
jgi:hypothetical protein